MIEAWVKPVENIVLTALEDKQRVLAITAPHTDAGTDAIAEIMASVLHRSGRRILLINLAHKISESANSCWTPGREAITGFIRRSDDGYDILDCHVTKDARFNFNNTAVLRKCLEEDCKEYEAIVVELPPVEVDNASMISPLSMAAACDKVFVVCVKSYTERMAMNEACELLRNAKVPLGGVIYSQHGSGKLGEEIAADIKRYLFWFPPLRNWLAGRAKGSRFLNS